MIETQALQEGPISTEPKMSTSHKKAGFRPDVEGLRALAILLVVSFHAGIPWFRGGFVGVDIFFVLSGYLITELLVREVQVTGRLDFARFYARRSRRLLPASLAMLVVVLIASFTLLSPIESVSIAKGAIATATYSSNLWFLSQSTNYFSAGVESNPLLHTWSLAVEEQFYLVWPLLVLLCMKSSKPHKTIVRVFWIVVVVSLIGSVWLTRRLPPAAFFGTPVRTWEFAAGGLAALVEEQWLSRLFRDGKLGWLGAILVLLAGSRLTTNGFPGALALIPVIGTILILLTGKFRTSASSLFKLLESRVFQVLGGLSYSWYLWHWPVLVFGRILMPGNRSVSFSVTLLLASLVLAWASHVLIENPIRFNRSLTGNTRYSLAMGTSLTMVGVLAGMACLSASQHASRSPENLMFINAASNNAADEHNCMTGFRKTQPTICSFGVKGGETVVLFGDSHAEQWLPALRLVADNEKWHLVTLLKAACPTASVPVYNPNLQREEYECAEWRSKALTYIKSTKPAMVLVTNATGYVMQPGVQDAYMRLTADEWEEGTRSTLQILNGAVKTVVLLRDTPRPNVDIPICLSRTAAHPVLFPAKTCDVQEQRALPQSIWQAEISASEHLTNVSVLDMSEQFCRGGLCPPLMKGVVVYRDSNHMTSAFASSLAPIVADKLGTIQADHSRAARAPSLTFP